MGRKYDGMASKGRSKTEPKTDPKKGQKKTQEPEEAARRKPYGGGSRAALQKEITLVQGGQFGSASKTTEKNQNREHVGQSRGGNRTVGGRTEEGTVRSGGKTKEETLPWRGQPKKKP